MPPRWSSGNRFHHSSGKVGLMPESVKLAQVATDASLHYVPLRKLGALK